MDETDIILIKLLMANSRTSFQKLADKLGLSVNAVHKRIQVLKKSGIIRTFTAKINLSALNVLSVLVFGRSIADSLSKIPKKFEAHDSIYWVAVAGGNYLYIGAYLKGISDLEPFMAFVKKEAQLSDPTVGIIPPVTSHPTPRDTTLYPLDYQIIYELHTDSWKNLSDIAEVLGVSAKTVRRRLSRMIDEEIIELSLEIYPDVANDITTAFHLKPKASVAPNEALSLLYTKYAQNLLVPWSFSNLPNLLIVIVWTKTMKETKEIQESFENEETIESVILNILYTGYIFDTWRDELILERGAPTWRRID